MRVLSSAFAAAIVAVPISAQTPAPQPDYSRITPATGSWAYAPVAGGSVATFTDGSARPQLTVTCARATRRVTLARPSSAAAPYLFVWTSSQVRNLPASFDPATNRLSAAVTAYDGILDAIAFSRGRFAVGISASPALTVPAWPETIRVIEDCRA